MDLDKRRDCDTGSGNIIGGAVEQTAGGPRFPLGRRPGSCATDMADVGWAVERVARVEGSPFGGRESREAFRVKFLLG